MISTRKVKYFSLLLLKHDLPAGLTVFFVALPLCLGIALASGAPLYTGILSGVIGGLIVSLLSSSPLSVSGPAAGLTTIVGAILLSNSYPMFMAIVVGAGVFQLVLGLLRLGVIANYFPSSVIKGMLAAIGIILISKQLPVAIGYGHPDFWSKEFINLKNNTNLFSDLRQLYADISIGALLISGLSLCAYFLWEKPLFDRVRFIPVPLFVVAASILMQLVFINFFPGIALKESQLVILPPNLFAGFQTPDFLGYFHTFDAIKSSLVIGMLASLETLLSIEAVDKLDPWHRSTPTNRELLAQGTGNILCGFVGALPITAVIVRSSANIDAGGRTKASAFVHGVFMIGAVSLIPFVINLIPLAALASILVVTGLKLTKPKLYQSTMKLGWNQFLPFIITIVVILFTDLLVGVTIGLLLSIFFIIRNNYKADYDVKKETHLGITTYTISLHTNVTFLDKSKIKELLNNIPDYSQIIIDGSFAKHIDHDVLETISEFCENAKRKGIEVVLKDVKRVSLTDIH